MEKMSSVEHPEHYAGNGLEAIEAITKWGFGEGFNKGNAIKYIVRAGKKGDAVEDLKKAIEYLKFEIERLEG